MVTHTIIQLQVPINGLLHKGEGRWDPGRPWPHRRSIYDFWQVFSMKNWLSEN